MLKTDHPGNPVFELPNSVSDQLYKMLRQKIMGQELRGGDRLIQTDIAQEFSISRTPIREALRRLEQEGLVERMPQGGLRVVKISPGDVKDLYGIRAVLSSYAAELACGRIDRETLDHLKSINHQARTVVEDTSVSLQEQGEQLFELNTVFHESILDAAGSPWLLTMVNNLRDMVLRFRVLCLQDLAIRREACTEHERIVELLESGDKDLVVPLMRKHILAGGEAAVRVLLAIDEAK